MLQRPKDATGNQIAQVFENDVRWHLRRALHMI